MFHQGDLHSGISLAIQQSKTVACFVRDEDSASLEWEDDWLQNDQISNGLASAAVILRIQAGSREADFLSAFCPVTRAPTLILIRNGQLLDMLPRETTQDQFYARVKNALGTHHETPTSGMLTSEPLSTSSTPTIPTAVSPNPNPPHDTLSTASNPTPPRLAPDTPPSTAQSLRDERNVRLESKGKQRADTSLESTQSTTSAPPRNDWLERQRQRQIDARRERDRILAQIEADKAERRARREEERKVREQVQREPFSPLLQTGRGPSHSSTLATSTNLQARLLDGATIRSQFPSEATLETDVRPWIDSHIQSKAPYTFKQILAPRPARAISVSEEHTSLRELGLLPSATLVLQPVQTYTDAYGAAPGGLLSLPYDAVAGAYGLVTGTLGWLRGGTFAAPPAGEALGGQVLGQGEEPREEESSQPTQASASNVRIRTLADQRVEGRANRQFYNGNSLDFQPSEDTGGGGESWQ